MQENVEESPSIGAFKDMLAQAVMLGMSFTPEKLSGSVFDAEHAEVTTRIDKLYSSTDKFLNTVEIDLTADDVIPLFKELSVQLPNRSKQHVKI